jgi:hypothetical protein
VTVKELRAAARRLLERDCAAQGVEAVVTDPALLAEVGVLMRPARVAELLAQEGDDRAR